MKLKARHEGRCWACLLFQFQLLLCFYKIDPTNGSFCHKKIPDGSQGQESLYKLVLGSEDGFRWGKEAQRSGALGLRPKPKVKFTVTCVQCFYTLPPLFSPLHPLLLTKAG